MKRRRVVRLVALSGLTLPLAGCSDEAAEGSDGNDGAADNDGNDNDTDGGDSPEEEEPADGPDDQEFSGTGDAAIGDVSIEGGLTVVDATHEGEGDFEVRLIPDDDGDEAGALFAYSSGASEGQTAQSVDEGTYQLSVVASGDWAVTVRQPRDTSGESPPLSISGTGNEVHGPFEFDGSYQSSGEYDGESISVNILSSTGASRQFVFHEGSIDNPPEFTYEDVGYIEIKSDGEWSVEIK
ncbi:hypothetical protein [Natrinema sp. SYSU A 869]|uniref:hypothetical protein n=1 Tax=Natrinema sp. SYSU A 869 TaxID=2871694 RepID=UPI001CA424BC|nr:hypothetical protein [Natrinema sp. SYSU A 869]